MTTGLSSILGFQPTGDKEADLQRCMQVMNRTDRDNLINELNAAEKNEQNGSSSSIFNTTDLSTGTSYGNMSIGDILSQAGIEDSDDILEEAGIDENLSIVDFFKGWINNFLSKKDENEEETEETKTEASSANTTTNTTTKTTNSDNVDSRVKAADDKYNDIHNETGISADKVAAGGKSLETGRYEGMSREDVIAHLAADAQLSFNEAEILADRFAQRR